MTLWQRVQRIPFTQRHTDKLLTPPTVISGSVVSFYTNPGQNLICFVFVFKALHLSQNCIRKQCTSAIVTYCIVTFLYLLLWDYCQHQRVSLKIMCLFISHSPSSLIHSQYQSVVKMCVMSEWITESDTNDSFKIDDSFRNN